MATRKRKKKVTETTEAPTRPDVIIPPLPPETSPAFFGDEEGGSISNVPTRLIVAEPDPHAPPPPIIEKQPELVVLGPLVPADEQDIGLIRLEHSITIPPITSVIYPDTFILARVDPNPGHIGTYTAGQWSPAKAGIDGSGPGTYEVRAMMGAEELYREYLIVHPDGRVETKG